MTIEPQTEADLQAALAQVDVLMARLDRNGDELMEWVAAIEEYEAEHYPIAEPKWWVRLFRFEKKLFSRLWR